MREKAAVVDTRRRQVRRARVAPHPGREPLPASRVPGSEDRGLNAPDPSYEWWNAPGLPFWPEIPWWGIFLMAFGLGAAVGWFIRKVRRKGNLVGQA
jgi:hypothetical protein